MQANQTFWETTVEFPQLTNLEVHVWRVHLKDQEEHLLDLFNTLSDEERERAERFAFKPDKVRFISARSSLRTLLGLYLGITPEVIEIVYGPWGKPQLLTTDSDAEIEFNLSHSEEIYLLAFTLRRQVGIDIEFLRPIQNMEDLIDRFFSPNEAMQISRLPEEQQLAAFYRVWTCKEAFIKATGEGVSRPLDEIEISANPEEPTRLINMKNSLGETSRWQIEILTPALGYSSALAVEGTDWHLRTFTLL
ncbi:MAG: 4'-phosphopantetheinyl transferase superfamily protein [Anaerolineales bacterium]|nr:4'-phosphopantetheinyl transferase superfamily protein [Anaerolineales bacterium]